MIEAYNRTLNAKNVRSGIPTKNVSVELKNG